MTTGGDNPKVSVVVPHYRQLDALALCIESLEAQTLPRHLFEIIVVDNNSPEGIEPVRSLVGDRGLVFCETSKGAGPARNRGVAESCGEVLAFIDADCVASPRWLEEGLAGLEVDDVVGGRVDVSVGDEAHMSGAEAFERVFAFDFKSYIEKKGFTGSGNLFCRREVFNKVGGFRPAVSEDMDWSHRATAMGYTLGYHEAAAIAHPARRDWGELRHKWSRVNRESMKLADARFLGRWRWLARNWLLPASIIPHGIRILRSPRLPDRSARLRGLQTLAAIRIWRLADAHRAVFERD